MTGQFKIQPVLALDLSQETSMKSVSLGTAVLFALFSVGFERTKAASGIF
jgi:hypothetical protein